MPDFYKNNKKIMFDFKFNLENTNWFARAWEFFTEHGSFKTPVFMPVWTKTSVKWIHREELDEMWAEIILNNTYHQHFLLTNL